MELVIQLDAATYKADKPSQNGRNKVFIIGKMKNEQEKGECVVQIPLSAIHGEYIIYITLYRIYSSCGILYIILYYEDKLDTGNLEIE